MLEIDEVAPQWSVLLAVDNRESARLLSILLDGFGYQALVCSKGEDALQSLDDAQPQVAVVDLDFPGAEGLCRDIKERFGIPLLLLLAPDAPDPEEQCRRVGADAWEKHDAEPERYLVALRRLASQAAH
jgi:two-component system response regulator RstA